MRRSAISTWSRSPRTRARPRAACSTTRSTSTSRSRRRRRRGYQKQVNVREIKLRLKIATNDYETKKNHVVRFLKGDDRVKVTIMFRGREQTALPAASAS